MKSNHAFAKGDVSRTADFGWLCFDVATNKSHHSAVPDRGTTTLRLPIAPANGNKSEDEPTVTHASSAARALMWSLHVQVFQLLKQLKSISLHIM